MAKSRSLGFLPLLRSHVREGVRAGSTRDSILSSAEERFPAATEGQITRMIRQEAARQDAVDRIMSRDLRRRTNMHAIVGCGAGETVRARITVTWTDPQTGVTRTYGHTTTLANQGRMMDILNPAIAEVLENARGHGYQPPHITSSMQSGSTRWRLEYVECV